jgi:hypothetical protein
MGHFTGETQPRGSIKKREVNSSKMSRPTAVIIFFILVFFPFSSIDATEYYAFRLTGSDCTLCHTNPQIGLLNQTGTRFQEEGYRYPSSWMGIFLYCLWGFSLFFILFGLYRREERTGRRIDQMRVEEAEETGAEILATVCPLCLISLDSAIKVLNFDDRIRVMDILELVREKMEP